MREHVVDYVENLGERKIIAIILSRLEKMPEMTIPFGDDASAIDLGRGRLLILKTDMLIDKTDVPTGMNLWQAARKAVVMNVSDLAAKGAKPIAILASIGLPRKLAAANVEQIADGLNAGAREYDAYVLGGDTGEASDLVISCAVFGTALKRFLRLRSGAKPGDIVAVTGMFGKPAAGLKILLEKLSTPDSLKETLLESVFMPHARLKEGIALSQSQTLTASIDSSDGLAWSLHELAKASGVGFQIDHVPVAAEAVELAKMHGLDQIGLAFYGGEEYELVVTVKPKLWEQAADAARQVGGELTKIGTATKQKEILLKTTEKTLQIEPRGWEHFKTKPTTQP